MDVQPLVQHLHETMRLPRSLTPRVPLIEVRRRRASIILEEAAEAHHALHCANPDLATIAHELADVIIAAYGGAVCIGIDLEPVIAEVHAANMRKWPGIDGGKLIKPKGWKPADVASVIREQILAVL